MLGSRNGNDVEVKVWWWGWLVGWWWWLLMMMMVWCDVWWFALQVPCGARIKERLRDEWWGGWGAVVYAFWGRKERFCDEFYDSFTLYQKLSLSASFEALFSLRCKVHSNLHNQSLPHQQLPLMTKRLNHRGLVGVSFGTSTQITTPDITIARPHLALSQHKIAQILAPYIIKLMDDL